MYFIYAHKYMRLDHPPSAQFWSVEKSSSIKLVPGAKKVGDRWDRAVLRISLTLSIPVGALRGFIFETFSIMVAFSVISSLS